MLNDNSGVCQRMFLLIAICFVPAAFILAQNANSAKTNPCTEEFEVATIKPHPDGDMSIRLGGMPGKYEAINASAKLLVEQAFNLPKDQVTGGTPWVESQRFDVNAKIADDCWQQLNKLHNEDRGKATQLMLQSLLKERFKLAVSHHPKELTVYALVVAKGGPKLGPAGSPRQEQTGGSFLMGIPKRCTGRVPGALSLLISRPDSCRWYGTYRPL